MSWFGGRSRCGCGAERAADERSRAFRRRMRWLAAICTALAAQAVAAHVCRAQDIDSVVTADSRTQDTIAGEIQDPAERTAYLSLFVTGSPRESLANAEAFLQRFPQSAYLARAYDVAARGCFDLGEYEKGLDYARQSLQFYPENSFLLVAVADVQARLHRNAEAIATAHAALDNLDRFARPVAIAKSDWPHVKATQQATAHFALGRALIQQALQKPASGGMESASAHSHADLLAEAATQLAQARALNPTDVEIAYLTGEDAILTGSPDKAAMEFAFVYESGGPLADGAKKQLQLLYESRAQHNAQGAGAQAGFEAFASQEAAQRNAAAAQQQAQAPQAGPSRPMEYAGSESCKSCHGGIYRQWKMTGMSRMLQPYDADNIIGDFEKNNTFYAGDAVAFRNGELKVTPAKDPVLFARMVMRNGRPYFDIKQSDGLWHSYRVDYTIGSKWQQAYATVLPNKEIHVFPIQYSTIQKRWINYWKVIDSAGTVRSNPLNWEKFGIETNYKANCAVCHTSQLRNVAGGGFDASHLEFREPGIGCEQCHGPSATHIAAMKQPATDDDDTGPLTPPVRFRELNNRDFVSICAQCHMQSNVHDPDSKGELNYSSAGRFYLRNPSAPYEEFSRKGFFKDGRFSQTTFIVEAFERSQCFLQGNATCGSCHNPHSHSGPANNTSLKFKDDPDRMCVQCHTQFSAPAAATAHTHHAGNSEGSRCISCHMPRIVDALLFRARSHQMDDIPSAEMTLRFGQADSPNACLLCHADKNATWVQTAMRTWWPSPASAVQSATIAH